MTEDEVERLEITFSWYEKLSGKLLFACCDHAVAEPEFSAHAYNFAVSLKEKKKELLGCQVS
jgi:hypothetical protein